MNTSLPQPSFSSVLQDYFCQRLINQLNVSPRTIESYRDAFRHLLSYAWEKLRKRPVDLTLEDIGAPFVLDFLDHLEKDHGNCERTRNARLAAIRSFMNYAAGREPASVAIAQRVLAIPSKRFQRTLVGFLSREEITALLDAFDTSTWSGRRDSVMFATFYNTGARVSEIVRLRVPDVTLSRCSWVRIHGKGRKERTVPLWRDTAFRLKEWLKRDRLQQDGPLFPNRQGQPLTRSGIESRLNEAVQRAQHSCPTLARRSVSPHVIRHTTAMHLLQSGVDLSTIALWLGHESPITTHMYIEADLSLKERALEKLTEPSLGRLRFQPTDDLLSFLESL